jgi:hypothetical protein
MHEPMPVRDDLIALTQTEPDLTLDGIPLIECVTAERGCGAGSWLLPLSGCRRADFCRTSGYRGAVAPQTPRKY